MKKEKEIKNLTIALVVGILILSLGIFLVGKNIPYGNLILVIGSIIVYVSIILLGWKS
jgi:ABC-type multidrug transport system permease subunit